MKRLILLVLLLSGCVENNDFFSSLEHPDHNYTQGLELKYTESVERAPKALTAVAQHVPDFWFDGGKMSDPNYIEYSAGHDIYTPEDLEAKNLIVDDNPYAGWLFGRVAKISVESPYKKDTAALYVGTIGPAAQGKEIQSWFHRLCGCTIPEGWDNQLKNEPGFILERRRNWISETSYIFGLETDSPSFARYRLGNVHTDLSYGIDYRIGKNLPHFGEHTKFAVYAFGGIQADAIARNIFFDGNTFRDSHRVDTERLVGQSKIGAAIVYHDWKFSFQWVARSRQYREESSGVHAYGSFTIEKDI